MWYNIYFLVNILVTILPLDANTLSLEIVPGKANLLLAAGDALKLDCVHVFKGGDTDVATFSKSGQMITLTNSKGFTILVKTQRNSETGTRTTSLEKMKSTVLDSGRYSCEVEGQSTEITVRVIEVTPVDAILPVQTTEALELRCDTSGMTTDSDEVRWIWSHQNKMLRNNDKFNMVNRENNGILQIKNPDRTNIGEYLCSLTQRNDVKIQKPKSVFLRASPVIDSYTMQAYHNKNIELKCMASGSPIPNIAWTKDGVVLNITNYSHVNEENNTVKSSVTLRNVDLDDAGIYSCNAFNDIEPFNATAQKEIDPRENSAFISASGPLHSQAALLPLFLITVVFLEISS